MSSSFYVTEVIFLLVTVQLISISYIHKISIFRFYFYSNTIFKYVGMCIQGQIIKWKH